jgi:cell division protein FtsL
MRRVTKKSKNHNARIYAFSKVRRERDPVPWRYSLMILFCIVFLASGFIYAAKQHFDAMNYSIKNEKLLKQIEELENEQRRLKLQKEEALSPAEIKKAARRLGFREFSAENIIKEADSESERRFEEHITENKKIKGLESKNSSDAETNREVNLKDNTKSSEKQGKSLNRYSKDGNLTR